MSEIVYHIHYQANRSIVLDIFLSFPLGLILGFFFPFIWVSFQEDEYSCYCYEKINFALICHKIRFSISVRFLWNCQVPLFHTGQRFTSWSFSLTRLTASIHLDLAGEEQSGFICVSYKSCPSLTSCVLPRLMLVDDLVLLTGLKTKTENCLQV